MTETDRVTLLVDVLGSLHTDMALPVQDWRHRDGQLVTDAEAETIGKTPVGDFKTAMALLESETDIYRDRAEISGRLLELLGPYMLTAPNAPIVEILPLLPPADRAEAEAIMDRIFV